MNGNYGYYQQDKNIFYDEDIETDFIQKSIDEADGSPLPTDIGFARPQLKARECIFKHEPILQSPQFLSKSSKVCPAVPAQNQHTYGYNSFSDTTNGNQFSQNHSHNDKIDSGYQSHERSGVTLSLSSVPENVNCERLGSLGSLGSEITRLDINNEPQATIQLKEVKRSVDTDCKDTELLKDSDRHHSSRFDSDEGFYSAGSTRHSLTERPPSIELRPTHEVRTPSEELFLQNDEGDTVLHVALIEEDMALFNRALSAAQHYSCLNLHNLQQQTPLHLAVIQNLAHVVRRLVAWGGSIDARDRTGNTPLHVACARSRMDCVLALTTHLEPHNVKDVPYSVPFQRLPQNQGILNYDGKTCLHLAAESGHFHIVSHLLNKCGADINVKEGKAGETVLHQAVKANNSQLARKLLTSRHCNVNARRYDGTTPYQLAYGLGLLSIQKLLLRAGASDYIEAETEEMMDMDSCEGAEPVSPGQQQLIPRSPPREDEFVYDDIKIGGELVS